MRDEKYSIKKAIETIEPNETTKARMFANIQRKAAEETEQNKPAKVLRFNAMMKWAIPVAACLVLVVAGVLAMPYLMGGRKAASFDAMPMDPGESAQIANPWISVENSKSLQEITGLEVEAPAAADGIAYNAMGDEIADVTFTIDGHEYTLRASKSTDDFSGLYGEYASETQIASDEGNADMISMKSGDETYRKLSWSRDDTNYILINTDGASEEEFLKVYESLKEESTLQ